MEYRLTLADKIHAAWLAAGAGGLVCVYWIAFYHSDLTMPEFVHNLTNPDLAQFTAVYLGYESAFPLADLFVAVTSALSAFYLIGRDARAVLFGLIGGGALGFLGLIDISFNLQHGLYAPAMLRGDGGMQLELAINIVCVVAAVWSSWRFWHHPLRRAEDGAPVVPAAKVETGR